MSITLARISIISSIFSAFSLILSWIGRPFLGTHEKVIGLFIISFMLSVIAVVTGILGIARRPEGRERKIAWIGTIIGGVLFVPIGAVVVIFLVIMVSGGIVH